MPRIETPTLKLGDTGPAVRLLQNALVQVGLLDAEAVDGMFDHTTEATLKLFQNWRELPVTGICDEATWEALNKQVARKG